MKSFMMHVYILTVVTVYIGIVGAFRHYNHAFKSHCPGAISQLYAFQDFLNKFRNNQQQPASQEQGSTAYATARKSATPYKLEKISNNQKRDWKKEEVEAFKNRPNDEVMDKQKLSYNFKKANEFPNLYEGWLKSKGTDQIANQAIKSVRSAQGRVKYMEVLFDPVPNLDEVAFGTLNNKLFRQDVVKNLKVPDYITKKGGPSTLEWANLYWMNRLAEGVGKGKKVLAISISGEGCKSRKKDESPTFVNGVTLLTLSEAKSRKEELIADIVIILSPCSEQHYKSAIMLTESSGSKTCIALNAPYSYTYDIGCGPPFELVYVMKRIPKGWIYRSYPRPYECVIEGPNYEVFKAQTFNEKPRLTAISKISMAASADKYGSLGNDRIFENRL